MAVSTKSAKISRCIPHIIFVPICLSCRHWGAGPSSPQYSSTDAIFPFTTRMKEVAWQEILSSLLNTWVAVMIWVSVVMICSTSPSHSPGYSQFARINSSTVKCSLVLCQFTQASGWKYSRIASASCRRTAPKTLLHS